MESFFKIVLIINLTYLIHLKVHGKVQEVIKKILNQLIFKTRKSKNLKYSFLRFDKEKDIEIFKDGGWHFNNIMSPKEISLKLKTFAHSEFSYKEYSDESVIKKKIDKKIDLFNRGHKYSIVNLDREFPTYILNNKEKFKEFIISK